MSPGLLPAGGREKAEEEEEERKDLLIGEQIISSREKETEKIGGKRAT